MNYLWTVCPRCSCEVTIQFVDTPGGPAGSVRRWSSDRAINDGRKLDVAGGEAAQDGSFRAACVCGEILTVEPAKLTRATTERPAV
ncbi:MAG: hypothetical protein ACM3NW_11165 [Syntrophomonadaceae bacterium]